MGSSRSLCAIFLLLIQSLLIFPSEALDFSIQANIHAGRWYKISFSLSKNLNEKKQKGTIILKDALEGNFSSFLNFFS